MQNEATPSPITHTPARRASLLWAILLIAALLAGAYLRLVGMNWDQNQHLHPDERFMTMVSTAVSPVNSLREYFDTSTSSLNPYNKGFGFFVYGTLPLFIVRYVADAVGQVGYNEITLVGRYVSALIDWLTILLVFLAGTRMYNDRRVGALAAAFYAFAVLPIQLAHYYTVDSFLGFFTTLTLLLAARVMTAPWRSAVEHPAVVEPAVEQPGAQSFPVLEADEERDPEWWRGLRGNWGSAVPFALFGVAAAAAAASKISAGLIVILLPVAAYIWWTRLPEREQPLWAGVLWRNLVIAGVVAFIVLRIFQPYAFRGPGFLGILPNEQFLNNMRELSQQSGGDVDFPPALQWARRPLTYQLTNMLRYGFGWPLGLLAWGGFLWMAWRMLKGEFRRHILLWAWTLLYFTWWSLNFSRNMRYEIVVYPTLAIIAAWALVRLWEQARAANPRWLRPAATALGVAVLLGSAGWAYAFTRIYTRPVTRVAASDWIYQNVPAAINLKIDGAGGLVSQPVGYPSTYTLDSSRAWVLAFQPREKGLAERVDFAYITDVAGDPNPKNLTLELLEAPQSSNVLATARVIDTFPQEGEGRGRAYSLLFENPPQLNAGQTYGLRLYLDDPVVQLRFSGPASITLRTADGALAQKLPEPVDALREGHATFSQSFEAAQSGALREVVLNRVVDWEATPDDKTLILSLSDQPPGGAVVTQAEVRSTFAPSQDARGQTVTFRFDPPLEVQAGQTYFLTLSRADGPGALAIYGSKTAVESSWDDPLPLPMQGYSPFDINNGLYRTDLNFEMYWDDNPEKLARFQTILNQADYLFITSNRQYATTVRVPERHPLTTQFYRSLMGCPEDADIIHCYAYAQPGQYQGRLGYELVRVFESEPALGQLRFSTQLADESFTVYDHPKVLIFQKRADYDSRAVSRLLSSVDLSYVVHVIPGDAKSYPANLLLPAERLAKQVVGGTWSQLFNTTALINRFPGLGLLYWYIVVTLLGWVVYPFVRLALRGLPDKGYPFSKLVGMLLLAYLSWLVGSANIAVTRGTITLVALFLLLICATLAWYQRAELSAEWASKKRYFLLVESVTLAFFAIDLLIRLGNPDLWHPYKGGEKPMDFSYFNAVIKSSTFPPYDPWFAGGYINYYYFGFVISGILVKWLGIVPAIAYNLVLPTFFAFLAMGAFSFGWNVLTAWGAQRSSEEGEETGGRRRPLLAGLTAATGLLILGNLGSMRMIWHGLMRLSAPNGAFADGGLFQKMAWTAKGLVRVVAEGAKLPYGPGEWYWIPSRAIPEEPITEFPFFTFLYGDPHAHLFALPLTLLALSWALSIVLGRWQWGEPGRRGSAWLHYAASLLLAGLVIGSLRPVNTWDLPTFLAFGVLALLYAGLRNLTLWERHADGGRLNLWSAGALAGSLVLLVGLSFVLYLPYASWYAQGYNSLRLWDGSHTPFWSYFTHWGLFLFIITTWLVWETREWMAATPVSHLRRLRPYAGFIWGLAVLLVVAVLGLIIGLEVKIAWVALPLAAWAAVLLLRPGQPDEKRFVLFMVGTALVLTLAVEVVVLVGDIGRMNTVFKFYLQAWTLLSLASAAALWWLWGAVQRIWHPAWRGGWQVVFTALVFSAALFPMLATADKVRDRMSPAAPHTLDGMAYMPYSTYSENGFDMRLVEDYQAIRWMQENVQGSPVIVEGNVSEYRWGTRYTIYTGLPGVVGWNWHQRQQRAVIPSEWVTQRIDQITAFYNGEDQAESSAFLARYNVRYIVVGQLERAIYDPAGIAKFERWSGTLWQPVYQNEATTIYEVLP